MPGLDLVFSAAVGVSGFFAYEYFKARNLVNALRVEAEDAIERIERHLVQSDWMAQQEIINSDKDHIPYVTHYPPPLHLYRLAIDETYLLNRRATQAIVLAHKAEVIADNMILGLRSPSFAAFSANRKILYIDKMVEDFRVLKRRLRVMNEILKIWQTKGFGRFVPVS